MRARKPKLFLRLQLCYLVTLLSLTEKWDQTIIYIQELFPHLFNCNMDRIYVFTLLNICVICWPLIFQFCTLLWGKQSATMNYTSGLSILFLVYGHCWLIVSAFFSSFSICSNSEHVSDAVISPLAFSVQFCSFNKLEETSNHWLSF